MRWRPWFWLLVSVACFCGALYFWRLGDRWAAEKDARPVTAQTNASTLPAASLPGGSGMVPVRLLSRPGNLNYNPGPIATKTNQTTSPTAYRLSNTTRPYRELIRSDSAILLQNALIDTSVSNSLAI